jgi:hypothetical protein
MGSTVKLPRAETYTFDAPSGRGRASVWVWTAVILGVALAAFLVSDRWFSIVDDETAIVNAARRPALETVEMFWSGQHEHEHPPLSDILLHYWLSIGGGAQWSLRLPSVVCYLGGLLFLALAAGRRPGDRAYWWLLGIGVLSPFAFHFARMAGWYAFCFLMLSATTWAYLRPIQSPWRWSIAVFVPALAFVYSNYYGWVALGFFVIDAYLREGLFGRRLKLTISLMAAAVVAYTPLWIVFVQKIRETAHHDSGPLLPKILHAGFNFYAIFVSESVAPWFWMFSLPALAAILLALGSAAAILPADKRRFLAYFLLLFAGLAVLDVNTKRLLFLTPWLFLSIGAALGEAQRTPRRLLSAALLVLALIGWGGTFTRRAYAAQHFIEPWGRISDEAAQAVREGAVVVSNSPTFLFDVNYSLERLGLVAPAAVPGWVKHPQVVPTSEWSERPLPPLSSVFFAKGTNVDWNEATEAVEQWLRSRCSVTSEEKLVPDTGRALKSRLFKSAGQDEYRVVVTRFSCPAGATPR